MIDFIRRPFGHEPVLKKEEIGRKKKKEDQRANDITGTLKRMWQFISEERALLYGIIFLVTLTSLLSITGPFLVGYIVDNYFIPGEMDGLSTILLFLLVVYILLSSTQYTAAFFMVGLSQRTVYKLRSRLFSHMQKLPVSFYDKRQHGELMSRMTNDIETISQTLNTSFIQFTTSIVTLIGTISVMLYLSPLLTLLTVLIIPVLIFAVGFITRRTGPLYKKRQRATGELNGYIEEMVSGQEIVKVFSQEETAIRNFNEKAGNLRDITFWAFLYAGFIPKVMNMLNNVSFTIVAGAGGLLVFYTDGVVTIGTIVVFAEYARQFTRPLADLSNQFNQVLSAIAGAERVFGIIDSEPEKDEGKITGRTIAGEIEFDDVSFSYDPTQKTPTIRNLSFRIDAGESVALIGATGAGKTTVMQLLARFYETDSGEVRIDGENILDYSRSTVRSQTAFVLQDPYLFESTIRENIRYGKLDATDEEVVEAAKLANAHDFIVALEEGYDTVLEADEGFISQGQKQLISIARALITDPAILLLDEATSSIDTVTELKIQEALERLMKDRTSIIIAHRLNTIKAVDRIFVMELGELVESGSEEELVRQRGRYYQMVDDNK
ncbi:ABC transporter ATP-binding protein [Salinicoccus roseus]|jgi:ATP-binding cassette subfamily B protein|uniref:Multidrug ABC transporter ATP-binding protein n=1 Tax=Salinicoccus roseus TaxID=45670 RepID=A0A265E9R8_9STAP|nr:ABC transporter ATP-binding protein [Salinicoccus roseus]OZT78324.1 multidrug ABC transporter ATP-binding protein [Salinicoccus roseus]RPE54408.1 ATP-binding cassette subfamily B protein [Salinicoccus roseus]GGA65771.1 putative ABC transporter ATP-binding protein YfiC [Salinicoccus roseus]